MSFSRAIATVGGLTLVSRLAGFVRDILTASVLGAGPVADAFFIALKLPNFFRRLFAEGAFGVAFVPLSRLSFRSKGGRRRRASRKRRWRSCWRSCCPSPWRRWRRCPG
jgi:putative peptidoglycan lipid II flippase